MKNLIALLFCSSLIYTQVGVERLRDYFVKVSTMDIGAYPFANVTYDTIEVDHHFPKSAIYLIPNYKLNLKDDICQQDYVVQLQGCIYFKKVANEIYDCTKNDSVQLHKITVRKGDNTILSASNVNEVLNTFLHTTSIAVLDSIKKDFLLRLKYCKIKLDRNDVSGVTLVWRYNIHSEKTTCGVLFNNIRYIYAADGTRLRTVHSRKVGNTWMKDSTDYCGNLIMVRS